MSFSVERIIDKAYLINKMNKGKTRNKCKNKNKFYEICHTDGI